jgi:hypothetical protein
MIVFSSPSVFSLLRSCKLQLINDTRDTIPLSVYVSRDSGLLLTELRCERPAKDAMARIKRRTEGLP